MVGQLPREHVTLGHIFWHVGVDYVGHLLLKVGHMRKPTASIHMCVFVSMSIKAVHFEAVTNLSSEAYISTLKKNISRRRLPTTIHSDHGTNFIGAENEIRRLYEFLNKKICQEAIFNYCSQQRIQWKYIPEWSPHFGGLWELTVKSVKTHLQKIAGNTKLNHEELITVLAQVEACLNSRPLMPMTTTDGEGIQALTFRHFLIGKPLCLLPEPSKAISNPSFLRHWQLCQCLSQQFWQRWSDKYSNTFHKFY